MKETGSVAAHPRIAKAAADVREDNYRRARLTLLGALSTRQSEHVRSAMCLVLDVIGVGPVGAGDLTWYCDEIYGPNREDAFELYACKRTDKFLFGNAVHSFHPLTDVQVIEIGTALLNVAEPWSTEIHEHVLKVITAKEAA